MACVDVVIPLAVFAGRVGTWTLNPWAAPRMLTFDWVTYITAPNYLRSAPLFTFPIGRTPGYIAPVGSSLGLADASPYMTPVYRLLNAVSPDRPTQLLGWLLLTSYVLTFYWSVKFLRRSYQALRDRPPSLPVELEIRIAAIILLLLPIFTTRIAHIALTQQWIIIAALYCAIFFAAPSNQHDWYVGSVCLGSALLHPYLLPPVVLISVPYLVRRLRHRWPRGLMLGVAVVGGAIAISLVMGYLAVGTQSTNEGFGSYAADLSFLINSHDTSRLLPPLPYAPATWEGIGFLGVGTIMVAIAALVALLHPAWRVRPSRAVVGAIAACVALALFATWPTVHLAGRTVVDLAGGPFSLDFIGNVFRGNGRFVWSLTWLVALGACAIVVAAPWRTSVTFVVLIAGALTQLVDSRPTRFVDRDALDYQQVVAVVDRQRAAGATRIEVQPPWIQYSCLSNEIPFDDLAPVLLAGAVSRLPVNSGYPGRPVTEFSTEICDVQASAFAAGDYEDDVLYVVNGANAATSTLTCEPLIHDLVACRAPL